MDFKDYYKILGLEPSATQEDIKRTYKKLARKYHPDVSEEANATEKFQEVSEAYEVLRKVDTRAEYDELREYSMNPNQFRGVGAEHTRFDSASAQGGFEDLLRSIFGEQGGFTAGNFNRRGEDVHYDVAISLEEAFSGGGKSLRLATPSGNKTINFTIPKGITEGKKLRLKGQGEQGEGKGAAGDIYLKVSFLKHSLFETEGSDVTLVLPVTPWEAALGTSVAVQTLGGKVNLKIPANSQDGKKMRLKGRGLSSGSGSGDQFVILKLTNPPVESESEKAAFEALKAEFNFDPREEMVRQI